MHARARRHARTPAGALCPVFSSRSAAALRSAASVAVCLSVLAACSTESQDPPVAASASAPAPTAPKSPPPVVASSAPAAPSARPSSSAPDRGASVKEPDGISYALLTAVGADLVIRYDKVDYLQSACAGRTDEEFGDSQATLRVCFSNVNPLVRIVTTSAALVLGVYAPDGSTENGETIDYGTVREAFASGGLDLPVRLTINGGVVTRIDKADLLAG